MLRWLSPAIMALQMVEALAISGGERKDMIVAIAVFVSMIVAIVLSGVALPSMVISVVACRRT